MTQPEPERAEVRERILHAAAELIADGGPEAATTRAVAAAADVQAPTIYRLFGDKAGLLDAVAEHAIASYMARKAAQKPHPDPVEDLRRGWDTHIAFCVQHPGLFAIMNGAGRGGEPSNASKAGIEVLRLRVHRIAAAGRLRVSQERALALIRSVGIGVVQTLLELPESERDPELPEAARETVMAAICGAPVAPKSSGVRGAAIALKASLDCTDALTRGERALLDELLERIANGPEVTPQKPRAKRSSRN